MVDSPKKTREKTYDKIVKKGENITEKIYPGANNKLILERKKVEIFKSTRSKMKDHN